MKTQKVKKNRKTKLTGSIVLKLMLVLSFVQAHWIPFACAAGTVAAAAMFGDKGYMTTIVKESDEMLKGGKAEDAVGLLKAKIAEYDVWRQSDLEKAKHTDTYLPDMYYQLAKAQQAAGISGQDLAENYKKAISSSNAGNALVWLYDNMSSQQYSNIVKEFIGTNSEKTQFGSLSNMAKQFEQTKHWPAFKKFLDVYFDESKEPAKYARTFEQGLDKEGTWLTEYKNYCKGRSDLIEYVLEQDYKRAKEFIDKEDFKKAAEVYEDILKASGSEHDTSTLEFTICQTWFNAGQYQDAISKIDSFITKYRPTNRSLTKDAILMKGRAYIQLGKIDEATDEFLALMIEYPETKEAPEANFFIGYCYMLQGKFDQAKEALDIVIKDYPQSSYASKARLCLTRIENMTEK